MTKSCHLNRADRCAALTNATLARAAAYLEGREQARRFYYLNTARKIVKLPFAELNAAHTPNAPARDGRGKGFISENNTLRK